MIVRERIQVGEDAVVISESASERWGSFFEDDGDTGYFYAMDLERGSEIQILDAVHIYNVESVVDRFTESEVAIVWSSDGCKSMLLINGYPRAAFDFSAKRGYCRTGFPNLSQIASEWQRHGHEWDDSIVGFFDL